jgi:3-hydroxyisobutyrate dehydrogenase
MASELGIDPKDAHSLFSTFNPAGTIGLRGKKMAEGDFEASFEMTMARKDVRLMLEAAGSRPLAVLPGIATRMDALIEAGHGHEDLAALGAGAFPVGSR